MPRLILICFVLLFTVSYSFAQDDWNYISTHDIVSSDTIKKKKHTLIFINKEPGFDLLLKQKLTDRFFDIYPSQVKKFNKNSDRKVIFIIDPGYKGVAAAGGGIVRFSPEWFRNNPKDIDVVTHEVMHLVQSYPGGAGPGWITEGIADYVRFTMGIDNEEGGWKLPEFNAKHSYTNAYRVTARFFYWLEKNGHKNLVKKLDNAMRTKTYSDAFWSTHTGKTIDELWDEYSKNPGLS